MLAWVPPNFSSTWAAPNSLPNSREVRTLRQPLVMMAKAWIRLALKNLLVWPFCLLERRVGKGWLVRAIAARPGSWVSTALSVSDRTARSLPCGFVAEVAAQCSPT